MRAVLRLERYTRFHGAANHDHGYVVRLYAYAGKPWIKVDYQLINAATDDHGNTLDGGKWSDPLYFNSLDLSWNLQLAGAGTVRTSVRNNGVDARALDTNGVELAYTMHDNYALRYANGATSYSTCTDAANDPTNDCDTAGFMDLADGTWGVQAVLRNMWELWPGGFQASDPANHNLQVQLFPDWSGSFYAGQVRPLYWLDDMQAVYKEVLLNFHGATPADAALLATARSFDRYPVPTLPIAHYRDTAVTLDLDGRTGRGTRLGTDTLLERYSGSDLNETNSGSYLAGWNKWYAAQAYRLIDASDPGDGPEAAETFIATESPDDFWNVQRWVLSELNARPEWMGTDYTFADDWAAMQLDEVDSTSASEGYWRADGNTASYPIAGSGRTNEPRDHEHGWFYHMGSYWYDYNLWVRDWLAWQGQFRRTRTVADEGWAAERAIGHAVWVTWLAYRATGDVALLDSIADYVGGELQPDLSPLCGRLPYFTGSSSAFEMGFLTRALQSTLADLKGQDWPRWAKVFLFVSSYEEWNFYYGRYAYHQDDDGLCTFNQSSSGTSWNVLDPVAWYYWNTGKLRFKQNNDDYYNGGLVGGGGPYTNTSGEVWLLPEPEWDGSYSRRYFDYVSTATRSDATPPAAPTNVAAILAAGTLTVNWTPSANAGTSPYYLIVSADRPLVECTTGCTTDTQSRDVANFRNWWAARPQACGGACASVTIPAVTCNPCYAAVFAFDDANNMSPMSAVATSQPGSGNPPPAPQGLRVN